jgi:hypothetical protein
MFFLTIFFINFFNTLSHRNSMLSSNTQGARVLKAMLGHNSTNEKKLPVAFSLEAIQRMGCNPFTGQPLIAAPKSTASLPTATSTTSTSSHTTMSKTTTDMIELELDDDD